MRENVHAEVRRALRAAGVGAGDGVVVACSGGGDSVALAHMIASLAGPMRLGAVALVCVDHGLRAASAGEADAVLALAASLGVPGEVVRVDVGPGRGPEDAARRARHGALEAARVRRGARWILCAHSADDQAEQVLLALLRGAGPAGLAGIPPVNGAIVRPLLAVGRDTLRGYARRHALVWAEDTSNADPRFRRARVRHAILPALRAENPRIAEALCRAAASVREAASALDASVDAVWAEVVRGATPRALALDGPVLTGLPPAIAKRLLGRETAARGVLLGARHLDALLAIARAAGAGGKPRSLALPGASARATASSLTLTMS